MTDPATPVSAPAPEAPPSCPNCGTLAPGRYCQACGQETSLALPTVRAMLREAAGRYVAFDGRMWRTLIGLLQPGFLTREYLAGRRRRYIRPARLFLVLSIGLFALLRFQGGASEQTLEGLDREDQGPATKSPKPEGRVGPDENRQAPADTKGGTSDLGNAMIDLSGEPGLEPLHERVATFNHLSRKEQVRQIFSGVFRYGPYAMFALLPLFALLLKIVYLGRARAYPLRPRRYAAHLVFGAHNHAFMFLAVAVLVILPSGLMRAALIIWTLLYLLLSMRVVYGGRWSGVIARAAVVSLVYLVFFTLLVVGLVIAAILVG